MSRFRVACVATHADLLVGGQHLTIVDDFLIPLLIRLETGGEVIFVPEARAWEQSPDRVHDEFRRRYRGL